MSNYTHQTAPAQFVEAAGIRFRVPSLRQPPLRFGATIDIPLPFFMHFTGTMDQWAPALTDGFAQDRDVILFNNAGVSSSLAVKFRLRLKRFRSTPNTFQVKEGIQ